MIDVSELVGRTAAFIDTRVLPLDDGDCPDFS